MSWNFLAHKDSAMWQLILLRRVALVSTHHIGFEVCMHRMRLVHRSDGILHRVLRVVESLTHGHHWVIRLTGELRNILHISRLNIMVYVPEPVIHIDRSEKNIVN